MLYNLYEYLHHTLGLHLWDLPALLVAIVTAACRTYRTQP